MELTLREKDILESIVRHFVMTGDPVGSRTLSKKKGIGLSAATIRNVMSDLEEKGYLNHPHTSAGRIPTTRGYREYVDNIIDLTILNKTARERIIDELVHAESDFDFVLEKTARILAGVSSQLGIILTPQFSNAILEKMELISIASNRLMVVLSLRNAVAKTITLELHRDIPRERMAHVNRIMNERLAGLTIHEIRATIKDRVLDLVSEETGLVRMFIESADKLFDLNRFADIKYTGTSNILQKPEFADITKFSALVELFEEKNIIIHMLERLSSEPGVKVVIGSEMEEKSIQECSLISAPYKVGDMDGLLGIIGPKRMPYRKVIPLVDFTAKMITKLFSEK